MALISVMVGVALVTVPDPRGWGFGCLAYEDRILAVLIPVDLVFADLDLDEWADFVYPVEGP